MARIYVADLGQYNAGNLVGEWIDIDGLNGDEIRTAIADMLKRTGGEEYAVHDHELDGIKCDEWPDFDKLAESVRLHDEHGAAWAAYVDHVGEDYAAEADFQDAYMGCYDSPEDWAEQWLEDTGSLAEVPEALRNYIDFEAYARDAGFNGDVRFVELNGECFVFHNH